MTVIVRQICIKPDFKFAAFYLSQFLDYYRPYLRGFSQRGWSLMVKKCYEINFLAVAIKVKIKQRFEIWLTDPWSSIALLKYF